MFTFDSLGLRCFNLHLGTQHSSLEVFFKSVVYKNKFQCHIILQKSFQYADFLLKKNVSLMSMLKIVLLLNIFVETMIRLKHLFNIKKREKLIILLMHGSDKKVCEDI